MKINLGCGKDYKHGYINCDSSNNVKVDIILDITKSLPFEDDSVKEVIMNHVLEHTQKPIEVIRELYRVCKNHASIKIRVPYFSSESAFSQIDHYSFYSWTTFDCLEKNHIGHWQGVGNFKIVYKKLRWRRELKLLEMFFGLFPRVYQEFFCWMFPAKELEIELRVKKENKEK